MNEKKTGLLVYPVIYGDISNGFQQIQLVGKGIFFTDQDEGWEYQEKMNEIDKEHVFWTNNIIPYVIKI